MHHIEIDQSGKVENTQGATVLAFSNGLSRAILIPAKVKRKAFELLRLQEKRGKFATLKLFSACLYLLLKPHISQLEHIAIDIEYAGRNAEIRGMLLYYLRRHKPEFSKTAITFHLVGKHSPAHDLAIGVFRQQKKPARIITFQELAVVLVGSEKNKKRGSTRR
jgi:hypothetical protein